MALWDSLQGHLAWDGSWRDICVPGVTARDWAVALRALRAAGFDLRLTARGAPAAFPEELSEVFERRGETSCPDLLTVMAGPVQLNCHFFDESEIEFDLDPREIADPSALDAVTEVMTILAATTGRIALLTPENAHDKPILRVAPSGATELVPAPLSR